MNEEEKVFRKEDIDLDRDKDILLFNKKPVSGVCVDYYGTGRKKYECYIKNGKVEGLYVAWHANGNIESEHHFKHGKWNGFVTEWHENGQKKTEKYCKDNEIDGVNIGWHKNGLRRFEMNYKKGIADSLFCREWDEDGKEILDSFFGCPLT